MQFQMPINVILLTLRWRIKFSNVQFQKWLDSQICVQFIHNPELDYGEVSILVSQCFLSFEGSRFDLPCLSFVTDFEQKVRF